MDDGAVWVAVAAVRLGGVRLVAHRGAGAWWHVWAGEVWLGSVRGGRAAVGLIRAWASGRNSVSGA